MTFLPHSSASAEKMFADNLHENQN